MTKKQSELLNTTHKHGLVGRRGQWYSLVKSQV